MLIDAAVLAGSQTVGIAPHSFNVLSTEIILVTYKDAQ